MKLTAQVLVVLGSIALAGCSSGGSSTASPPANVVNQGQAPTSLSTEFTLSERFDLLALGETVDFPAVSRQASYTIENGKVVLGEVSAAETGALHSHTLGLDPVITPLDFVITSAAGTKVVFEEIYDPQNSMFKTMFRTVDVPFVTEYDSVPSFEFGNSPFFFEFTEVTNGARDITFDSSFRMWDYQFYGVWMTGFGGSSGTIGAVSAGATTPVANIPNTSTATFTGLSSGLFFDNAGDAFLAHSTMQADASFTNRTVGFATSNTHITPLVSSVNALIADGSVAQPFTATPGLNLSGAMSYAVGENKLSGPVSSTNGMTGVVDANFYGPVANEIGGSFAVKGTAGNYIGAFGGKP